MNKAIGKMPCLCCGEAITVKQNDTGTVSVSCPDCDFTGYGKAGTDAQRRILARVKLKAPAPAAPVQATPAPTPAAKAPPPPAAPPAAARRNTVFG